MKELFITRAYNATLTTGDDATRYNVSVDLHQDGYEIIGILSIYQDSTKFIELVGFSVYDNETFEGRFMQTDSTKRNVTVTIKVKYAKVF